MPSFLGMKLHREQQLASEKSMLKRFQGPEGRLHLIEALRSQPLVRDNDLAVEIERLVTLEGTPAGTELQAGCVRH